MKTITMASGARYRVDDDEARDIMNMLEASDQKNTARLLEINTMQEGEIGKGGVRINLILIESIVDDLRS